MRRELLDRARRFRDRDCQLPSGAAGPTLMFGHDFRESLFESFAAFCYGLRNLDDTCKPARHVAYVDASFKRSVWQLIDV
jgi:hypothetical protein